MEYMMRLQPRNVFSLLSSASDELAILAFRAFLNEAFASTRFYFTPQIKRC